jgi:hypothetical protein
MTSEVPPVEGSQSQVLVNSDLALASQIRVDRAGRIGGNTKSGERRVNGLAHGTGTEVRMPQQRTAPKGEQWFTWTVAGESYRPGSNPAWRSESYSSEIAAETAGEALEKIVRGLGKGTTGDNTIPWDLIEQDREITITIKPSEEA